jgi:hypothetical protein
LKSYLKFDFLEILSLISRYAALSFKTTGNIEDGKVYILAQGQGIFLNIQNRENTYIK